jgi:hypothetical protein
MKEYNPKITDSFFRILEKKNQNLGKIHQISNALSSFLEKHIK